MEKLELKYLKGYLGTGLKVIDEESGEIFEVCGCDFSEDELLVNDNIDGSIERYCLDLLKPLLIPLSALTETLEDGSVPIVELAKMAFGEINILDTTQKDGLYAVKFIDEEGDTTVFSYNTNVCSFQADYMNMEELERRITIVPRQLQLFEYLYSKYFDINGLIPAGLAIDKRTVK